MAGMSQWGILTKFNNEEFQNFIQNVPVSQNRMNRKRIRWYRKKLLKFTVFHLGHLRNSNLQISLIDSLGNQQHDFYVGTEIVYQDEHFDPTIVVNTFRETSGGFEQLANTKPFIPFCNPHNESRLAELSISQ